MRDLEVLLNFLGLQLQAALLELQLLLLHHHQRVLGLLLRLLLLGLLLVHLQRLLRGLRHHPRQRLLNLRWQVFVFGRQGHTQLRLNLLAVLVARVLSNVRHKRGRDDRGLGVLPNAGRNQRVLHHRHVHRNVRLMVLVEERFNRVTLEERHVLGHRVTRLLVFWQGHKFVGVFDAQNLQHVAVQLGHVVDVRRSLCHLHDRLILDDPLAHSSRVGVADGNHVYMVVVFLLGGCAPNVGLVVVRWLRVVTDDCRQQPQLLLERVVQSGLNRRHNLELALQQGQRSAYRRLTGHVANLHVRRGREPTTFLNNVVEQRVQNLAGLLVWQG